MPRRLALTSARFSSRESALPGGGGSTWRTKCCDSTTSTCRPCQSGSASASSSSGSRLVALRSPVANTRLAGVPRVRSKAASPGTSAMRSVSADQRDTIDLLQRGAARLHLRVRGVALAARAAARGSFLDLADRRPRDDQFAQLVGEQQDLGDRTAALVAAAAAIPAAAALAELEIAGFIERQAGQFQQVVGGRDGRRAMRAVHPQQALRDYSIKCRDEAVGVDDYVDEAADDVEHVVGVHGRKNKVSGECRLHRDLRGVGGADLADHDLVGVVAQDRTQGARERQALLLVDRNLQHARKLVFDRVLDGDDLVAAVVDLGYGRVQRGGFS